MTWWLVVAGAVIALFVFGLYLSSTAGRLDRLHKRIDTSILVLDTQALRRSAAAQELALSGLLDPATAVLVSQAAHDARQAAGTLTDPARTRLESDLTRALQAALTAEDVEGIAGDPVGAELLEELHAACVRTQMSRRFHNDGVRACRRIRDQRLVRWCRLAGHTERPAASDWDDEVPAGLSERTLGATS